MSSVKGHREWDKDIISYKLDQSPAVISFIEVEHQKRLSARNFIEISCSLIASTGASLKLIKMDESQGVIGNRKKVRNEIKTEALVIKNTDFEAVATSRNLVPEEAEFLKLDQERSIADTMALKRFYMWNLYGGNDMSIKTWNKLCNKEFVERFCPPEPRKHFLRLSHFRKQGYDENSAIEGLKAKDIAQWENTCYNTKDNIEDSVAKDIRKTYSANHWEAIRELFQSLGFTGIDDERILYDDQVKVAFETSRKRFIELRNQSLLLFGFKSRAKETPDLKSAIKAINAIVGNYCGYTIKSKRKLIGSKGQQIWKYSYQIDRKPYNGLGFDNQDEITRYSRDPIAPVLPSYKPKMTDEVQNLFDSIPIANNSISECAEHRVSDSSTYFETYEATCFISYSGLLLKGLEHATEESASCEAENVELKAELAKLRHDFEELNQQTQVITNVQDTSSIGGASTTENISPNSSPNEDLSNERILHNKQSSTDDIDSKPLEQTQNTVLLTSQDTPSIESEQMPINQDISEVPIIN
ncbi:7690_t:CDS:2 [Entrophospora sp. SA101]|nr:7690_t:CDS:2 [Entrophospora sp. SA101]